jgi:hypothetical protein
LRTGYYEGVTCTDICIHLKGPRSSSTGGADKIARDYAC